MPSASTLRLLTSSTNEKGDLFNDLMKTLFEALNYDKIQLNVAKAGREIDIQGRHRHAARLLRAECKAHEKKMGGRELNAFLGSLTRERKKHTEPIDGYFVSLGGFTETAIEQEEEYGQDGLILLAGPRIVEELERQRIIISDAVAAEQAGQCASRAGMKGKMKDIELLAYTKGYVKAVYYAKNKQRTHFALIDAEGTALAEAPAQEVIEADQAGGGTLHQLTYLAPAETEVDARGIRANALAHYQHWLSEECGFIQLIGLPASLSDSTKNLNLERLFIPLKAIELKSEEVGPRIIFTSAEYEEFVAKENASAEQTTPVPQPISHLLAPGARLALLASPGGGKSTLLKRLAMEYGFENQPKAFADELPAHAWLPLYIRCRSLQDLAKQPFMQVLKQLPYQVSMLPELAAAFEAYIHERLQLGQVLLLIDGLDEISDEGNRKIFTGNLLSFLKMHPQVTLVLTSREAGFRLVADVVASKCTSYRLAPFDKEDVARLCVQWHAEVVNTNDDTKQKALKLAEDIWNNERIRALAENPLLLTTLLVVNRRRGGELPKNRTVLYSKAVEVLIQTWNQEAYEPLDEEEALVQLSYLACYMMEQGIQQITRRELIRVLTQAKDTVPELRFSSTTPAAFIKQVEYRSSLLMEIGRKLVDGQEQQVYEFRHLTFQEYLAARGYVEGHYARGQQGIALATMLAPHFQDARWQEVIPLAVVLAKRHADDTILQLTEVCAAIKFRSDDSRVPFYTLIQCILDEVLINSPEILMNALRQVGRGSAFLEYTKRDYNILLVNGKFGFLYQQVVEEELMKDTGLWNEYATAFTDISITNIKKDSNRNEKKLAENVMSLLRSPDRLLRLRGLYALENLAFNIITSWDSIYAIYSFDIGSMRMRLEEKETSEVYQIAYACLVSNDYQLILGAGRMLWLFSNLGSRTVLPPPALIAALFTIQVDAMPVAFTDDNVKEVLFHCLLGLIQLPLLARNALANAQVKLADLTATFDEAKLEVEALAAWYGLIPITDEELVEKIDSGYKRRFARESEDPKVFQMLSALGKKGKAVLAKRKKLHEAALKEAILPATSKQL